MTSCKGVCNRFEKAGKQKWWRRGIGMRCKCCDYYFKIKTSGNRCPCCNTKCKSRPMKSNNTRDFHDKFQFRY